ncbi:type II CAAX prenyl endopeptidase Rce1 family protein [Exiguobacterium sp. s166]|uniref:CPBP family glutamic-type intramembrane protease n=1 Tax=Exiguobacterium sp. s166 TaxID=2751204 RepID=UPI00352FFF80
MIFQLGNTFLFGLFFALIALKLNNLWSLIFFHTLWDFSSIAADVLNVNLAIPNLVTQVFVALAILIQLLLKRHDLSHLKRPLAA